MRIGRLNFQRKLMIYFSLVLIGIVLISGIFFYTYTAGILQNNTSDNMSNLAQKMSSQLDVILRELDHIAVGIIANHKINSFLNEANRQTITDSSKQLEYQRMMNEIIVTVNTPLFVSSRITLFNIDKGFFITLGESQYDKSVTAPYFAHMFWVDNVIRADGAKTIIAPHQDDWKREQNTVFSLARLVKSTSDTHLAILEVQKPYNDLKALSSLESLTKIYIFSEDGQLFYPLENQSKPAFADHLFSKIQHSEEEISKLDFDGNSYLYASHYSDYSGLYTVIARSSQEFTKPVTLVRNMTFLIGGLMILISLGVNIIITRWLTLPIRQFRHSLQRVQLENLSLDTTNPHTNDELFLLNKSFQKMLERLKLSIHETVLAKENEAKSRFLALQSQMNPHFLYNTLNTIAIMAEEKGQADIMEMCRHLIRMLQYISSHEQSTVTLEDELAYVRHYMKLMKCRYESRFSYEILVEGNPASVTLPKLIIQPLVENCFKHGLQQVSYLWNIKLLAVIDGQGWKVTIRDNGAGFPERTLLKLQADMERYKKMEYDDTQEEDSRAKGKGILNTFIRLQHFYSGRAEINLSNHVESGAIISVSFREEELSLNPSPNQKERA